MGADQGPDLPRFRHDSLDEILKFIATSSVHPNPQQNNILIHLISALDSVGQSSISACDNGQLQLPLC